LVCSCSHHLSASPRFLTLLEPCPADPAPAGFVFLAFGLNWVDAGGLLGGRLDEDVVRVPVRASGAPREVKRSLTM
jgi:hypothetical protein